LNIGWKFDRRAQAKDGRAVERSGEVVMALRFAGWRILFWLLLFLSLAACSVAPIRKESITVQNTAGLSLPAPAQLAVYMSPEDLRKQYILRHLFSEFSFEEGMTIQRAAIKVLSRVFAQVLPAGELQNPHLIAKVSGSTHIDRVWGNYNAEANLTLYNASNNLIGRFTGKGRHMSALVNDTNALENAYIKAFLQVTDAMLRSDSVVSELRHGFPHKYPLDSQGATKIPVAPSSPGEEPKGFETKKE
jgi:hypothetical protein